MGTWVSEKNEVKRIGPAEMNHDNVQFYCKHAKQLKNLQVKKARLLIEHDCIQYTGDDPEFGKKYTFVCLPLNTEETVMVDGREFTKKPYSQDYNWSTYKIAKEGNTFTCNCQGWTTKQKRGEIVEEGANCAHVLALYFKFKIDAYMRRKEERPNH